jgi:sulfur-carrier protein
MTVSSSAPVRVGIPPALLGRTGNRRWVHVSGDTVRDIIEALERDYPGLRFNICHETGELRPFVNIFVDGEEVRYLDGLDTAVPRGATIHVIHSMAGG